MYFQHEAVVKVVYKGYHDDDDEMTVTKIMDYMKAHADIPKGNVEELLKAQEKQEAAMAEEAAEPEAASNTPAPSTRPFPTPANSRCRSRAPFPTRTATN